MLNVRFDNQLITSSSKLDSDILIAIILSFSLIEWLFLYSSLESKNLNRYLNKFTLWSLIIQDINKLSKSSKIEEISKTHGIALEQNKAQFVDIELAKEKEAEEDFLEN